MGELNSEPIGKITKLGSLVLLAMPSYRSQHFLPTAYLREFSIDDVSRGRKRRVWRLDRHATRLVTVESQCAGDYFYSRAEAESVERMFGQMEGLYAECVTKIKMGKEPSVQQYFGLILMMFDLHLRNDAYQNRTSGANLHAYRLRLHALRTQFLSGRPAADVSDDEVARNLQQRWRVKVLRCAENMALITSDNPSVWTASDESKPRLAAMVMPITPLHLAVAYDRRFKLVHGSESNETDSGISNHMQCRSAVKAIYSHTELPAAQREDVLAIWNEHPRRLTATTDEGWEASLVRPRPGHAFSFIRNAVPLF